jgi:hypothetical protein
MTQLKLKPIASNMNLIDTPDYIVLFSYSTPVACYNKHTLDYSRTSKKWSMTTSRHINKWLDENEEPQTVRTNYGRSPVVEPAIPFFVDGYRQSSQSNVRSPTAEPICPLFVGGYRQSSK